MKKVAEEKDYFSLRMTYSPPGPLLYRGRGGKIDAKGDLSL